MVPNKVYIGGLPPEADRSDIDVLFRDIGDMTSVWVARSPPGFGFVTFATEDAARRAIEIGHDQEIKGQRITVEFARSDRHRSGPMDRNRNHYRRQTYCPRNHSRDGRSRSPIRSRRDNRYSSERYMTRYPRMARRHSSDRYERRDPIRSPSMRYDRHERRGRPVSISRRSISSTRG